MDEERGRGADPTLALFWGEDEFLTRDAAAELFADLGVRPDEVAASEWRGGETANLVTPSLFGDRRGLLVTAAGVLPEAAAAELRAYLAAPPPDAVLVITAVSRGKSGPA